MIQPYLSVIIPAFNEENNLVKGEIGKVVEFLKEQKYDFEVILVDDGSTDQTLAKLRELASLFNQVTVIANTHGGKALAVAAGMRAAQGKWRLYSDFDQSTPISEVNKLLAKTREGYEIVIGSREAVGAKREAEPRLRHLMGRVFNTVVRMLAVPGIQDTQCGFKLFSQKATQELFPLLKVTTSPKRDAFTGAFDVELLYLARMKQMEIAEVPVHWKHEHTLRVNPLKDSYRMFMEVVTIRLFAMGGGYER